MQDDYQVHLIQAIRSFFQQREFSEIIAPPVVQHPGIEPHIHPLQVYSAVERKLQNQYLHSSPEFFLKHKLSQGHQKIYSLGYVFRDELSSPIHRSQFLMLEWYRSGAGYEKIMDDCEDFIFFCHNKLNEQGHSTIKLPEKFVRKTVRELFDETLEIELYEILTIESIKKCLTEKFPEVPLPQKDLPWEDYYFLLFLNKVEPELSRFPFLLLYEFPAPLAALSRLKPDDTNVCLRFEIYMNGVELCNCFDELVDLKEQKLRVQENAKLKADLYQYSISNSPEVLLNALDKGLPKSSGVAMGIDRLAMCLLGETDLFFGELSS